MEDIKTVGNDFGKSTESEPEIKLGKRTVINMIVHEWDGKNYVPVSDSKPKTKKSSDSKPKTKK